MIVRSNPTVVAIDSYFVTDVRLSWGAKGLLATILCLSATNERLSFDMLKNLSPEDMTPYVEELVNSGYLSVTESGHDLNERPVEVAS